MAQSTREEPISTARVNHFQPGQHYLDRKMYYTYPGTKRIWTRKNATAPEVPSIEHVALVMSTDPAEKWVLNPVTAHEKGFDYPETLTINELGWGAAAAERWHTQTDVDVEPWDLYQRIRDVYVRHIEFSDEMYYDVMTLWVMGTYVFQVFDTFPYVHFGGTKASGKSQNLRILQVLGFNASLSANMTPADMFRTLAGNPGLMCIDEAEDWRSERGQALLEIIRSGYKKGATVNRQRPLNDGKFVQDRFNVYGPKAMASINPLDGTTASRTIKVAMDPAFRTIEDFKSNPAPHAALINDLHYFGLAQAAHIDDVYGRWTVEHRQEKAPGLTNRGWELAAPLVTMADYVGGDTLMEPVVEWMTNYIEAEQKRDDSADNIRTLAIALPTLLKDEGAEDGLHYPLKKVLAVYKEFADEDVTQKVTTRTMTKWLIPLGFKDFRIASGGKQVRITEDDLRNALTKRRIAVRSEDLQWLNTQTTYQWNLTEAEPEQEALEFGSG